MKLHLFALLAPLVFLFLAACSDVSGLVEVEVTIVINCERPPPLITDPDSLATWFNGACPYYIWDGDSLKLITPAVV